ncbi:MAG: MBL fold metallo-hydrolase [Anaerotignum sp.]|nr:MBL fold metallo-hydrolase [Anaerotignum sp.]
MTNDLKYIGVNDHEIDLFEGQYMVPDGMAYNSYVIMDEKIAVMDSVERKFTEEWLNNLKNTLGERTPDYLIVQHMEPDHSANIKNFLQAYPEAKVVASANAFRMMQNFFGTDFSGRSMVVKDGDKLNLGKHELTFLTAPMVHWPEVIMTYDAYDKVLFSADTFGKFGALDVEDEWECEARRYYFGIVGKYGPQVQAVLKKAAALDIRTICPLHGPVLKENLDHYIGLYDTWSSYSVESEGVMIAYTSIYGHTKAAVELLAQKLEEKGCPKVVLTDLARSDWAEAVEDAFRYGKLVLATTTYNADIFPDMKHFIQHLTERNFQNRTVALIENGSWAPKAAGIMKEMLSECKDLTFTDTTVKILSAMNEENIAQLNAMAQELCGQEEAAAEAQPEEKAAKKYICTVCGYEHEGELPADYECPLCGVGPDLFELAE